MVSKEIYLEDWENVNDNICEISDTIQEFSAKDFVTATLLHDLTKLVERRFAIWQKLQTSGFTAVNQARAAFFLENKRRELSDERK